MADSASFDVSELRALSSSIDKAIGAIPREVRQVVSKGALNIKNDTRDQLEGHGWWTGLAQTVNYQMRGNAFFSEAEVGFDDVGQGELAGIHEFGSSKRGPHPTLYPAADREAPKFEKAVADAAAKALEGLL